MFKVGLSHAVLLLAQAGEAAAEETQNPVLKFLNDGGEMMYVIAAS